MSIQGLSNLRLKLKQDKNPAQILIKVLMNSMYGKTITKPVETDTAMNNNQNDVEHIVHLVISMLIMCSKLRIDITLKGCNQ